MKSKIVSAAFALAFSAFAVSANAQLTSGITISVPSGCDSRDLTAYSVSIGESVDNQSKSIETASSHIEAAATLRDSAIVLKNYAAKLAACGYTKTTQTASYIWSNFIDIYTGSQYGVAALGLALIDPVTQGATVSNNLNAAGFNALFAANFIEPYAEHPLSITLGE